MSTGFRNSSISSINSVVSPKLGCSGLSTVLRFLIFDFELRYLVVEHILHHLVHRLEIRCRCLSGGFEDCL